MKRKGSLAAKFRGALFMILIFFLDFDWVLVTGAFLGSSSLCFSIITVSVLLWMLEDLDRGGLFTPNLASSSFLDPII
ncbi:hypothetical protein AYI68_g3176 [Smittium mucronatum]|uniref:Uncharacterized protein n=1 Tax=Smittium mucronatum TaxID=133383 RepID=A0A1R0H0Q1_9FUNG|nr:hypothetical protein AYI68_g3176 [Smittium mucronatum]